MARLQLVASVAGEGGDIELPAGIEQGDYITLCTQHATVAVAEHRRFTQRLLIEDSPPWAPIAYYDTFVDAAFLDDAGGSFNPGTVEIGGGGGGFGFLHQCYTLAVFRNVAAVTTRRFLGEFEPPFDAELGGQPPWQLKFVDEPTEFLGVQLGAPSGNHEAAVLTFNMLNRGIIGGSIFGDFTGGWTVAETIPAGRSAQTTQFWDAEPLVRGPMPPGSWRANGSRPQVHGFMHVLSLTHEPATRQFPRDDTLGLGSSPRIYPPPRRGRLAGGFQ